MFYGLKLNPVSITARYISCFRVSSIFDLDQHGENFWRKDTLILHGYPTRISVLNFLIKSMCASTVIIHFARNYKLKTFLSSGTHLIFYYFIIIKIYYSQILIYWKEYAIFNTVQDTIEKIQFMNIVCIYLAIIGLYMVITWCKTILFLICSYV